MNMTEDPELKGKIQRIATLVEQLENSGDPHSRALTKELLESMMALHGAGLERILELASGSGEAGQSLIRQCARDELVSSLLLLYGLHPDDLRTRVNNALDKNKSFLQSHAAHAELLSIDDQGAVRVQLHHKPNGGCGSSAASVRSTLEAALQDAAPDASAILVQETGAEVAGFVSITQLQNGQPLAVPLSANPGQGSH